MSGPKKTSVKRFITLLALTFFVVSCFAPILAATEKSALISDVNVLQSKDSINIKITADKAVAYKIINLTDPRRSLIIELSPAKYAKQTKNIPVNWGAVQSLRIGQFSPDVVRIVVDLTAPIKYRAVTSNKDKVVTLNIKSPRVATIVKTTVKTTTVAKVEPKATPQPTVTPKVKTVVHTVYKTKTVYKVQRVTKPWRVSLRTHPRLVSIDFKDAPLTDVLEMIAEQTKLNIITDGTEKGKTITVRLNKVPLSQALNLILKVNGLDYRRDRSVIIIGDPKRLAKEWPAPLPPTLPPATITTEVITLENAKADDVVTIVKNVMPDAKLVVDRRLNVILVTGIPADIKKVRSIVANIDLPNPPPPPPPKPPPPTKTVVIPVKYADPTEVLKQLGSLVPAGSVVVDKRTNSLIVTGTETTIQTINNFLVSVDVQLPQVMLDCRIVSINETGQKSLGINWPSSATTFFQEGGVIGNTYQSGQYTNQGIAIKPFTRTAVQLAATLNFLVSKGDAKILANPRIATLDRQKAKINISDRVPIVYYDPRAGTYQVQYIDVGIKLEVQPTVNRDGYVTLFLKPEVSNITGFVQSFPQMATREAETNVCIKDGETVIIGGLIRDDTQDLVNKVPLLGDIPIIGYFFRYRNKTRTISEAIIMVTPTILSSGAK